MCVTPYQDVADWVLCGGGSVKLFRRISVPSWNTQSGMVPYLLQKADVSVGQFAAGFSTVYLDNQPVLSDPQWLVHSSPQ